MTATPTSLDLDAWLAKAGPAADSFARLWRALWTQSYVPAELLELCRLNLARLHQDATEMSAASPHLAPGVPSMPRRRSVLEGLIADDGFSPAERAILSFSESYWIDPQTISDDAADAVKSHIGEAGLVFLIEALGCLDGRIRAARCVRDVQARVASRRTSDAV